MNRHQIAAIIAEARDQDDPMTEERAEELLRQCHAEGLLFIITSEPMLSFKADPQSRGSLRDEPPKMDADVAVALGFDPGKDVRGHIDRVGKGYVQTFGVSEDPKHPAFNWLDPVVDISFRDGVKFHEWPDGTLAKVPTREWLAQGAFYECDGRTTRNEVYSGPEAFTRDEDGTVRQWGAASALLARLLEAKAAANPRPELFA